MSGVSAYAYLDPLNFSAWDAVHNPEGSTLPDPLEGLTIADDYLELVLRGRELLVQDGAMGTQLQAHGLAQGGQIPDLASITDPDVVTLVHKEYVDAGAQMVTTNTFGANEIKLAGAASVEEVCAAAVSCARKSGARYVAGSIGPLGKLLQPFGDVSFDEAYRLFYQQACALSDAGADVIAIETMTDLREAKAAVLAAKAARALPVFASMTYGKNGRTMFGTTPAVAAATLSSLGANVVCVNCSLGPSELLPIVKELLKAARCPVAVRPNAGMPRLEQGKTVYDVTPEEFARAMAFILDAGASIVGGCCGTNPEFTRKLADLVAKQKKPALRFYEPRLRVCSSQSMACLGVDSEDELDIACAIDPCDEDVVDDVRAGDVDSAVDEAMDAFDDADIVELCFAKAEVSEQLEGELYEGVVSELEETSPMPLLIRTDSAAALEKAVRSLAGKPLVGMVSPDRGAVESMLAVAKRYGCALALPSNEAYLEDAIQASHEAGFAGEDMVVGA